MTRYPDNPNRVSLHFLRELDTHPPGTWIGSPKLDGYRRVCENVTDHWEYRAKHTAGPAATQMSDALTLEFESLPWPAGIALDCEFVGRRCVEHVVRHSLHIFDILFHEGEWLGGMGYERRLELLNKVCQQAGVQVPDKSEAETSVFLVPTFVNPGLVERFMEQLENPLSEGLVIRHRHSGLIGSFKAPASNPSVYKCKFDEVPSGMDRRVKRGT